MLVSLLAKLAGALQPGPCCTLRLRAHKAAVFVLEEFDLFAKRTKQAVLYNLLDALVTSGMQVNA